LDQRPFEVADGARDQLGPVVDRHDLDAGGQAVADLGELGAHAPDDVARVLPLPHDDDAGNRFALAVEVRGAAAPLGAEGDGADVPDPDRRAGFAPAEDDVLEVLDRRGAAAAAHHVLGAAELDQAAGDVVVAAADRVDDLAN